MSKRDRDGSSAALPKDINSEECKAMLQRMITRSRGDWPSPTDLTKKVAEAAEFQKANAAVDGQVPYMSPLAELLYLHHDRPHKDCRYEWWYVNGALGRSKNDPRVKYSFFAAFFRLNALGDTYCHALNWALVEERFEVDAQTGAEKAVPGTSRYHTCSLMDPITPTLLLGMMKAGLLKSPDEHLTRQLRQIYEDDCVPAPDYLMQSRPQAFPDPYSFCPSPFLDDHTSSTCTPHDDATVVASPTLDNAKFGGKEGPVTLLHLDMDGNSLKSVVDLSNKCPTTKARKPPVYHLHLGGETISSTPEGNKEKSKITLEVSYTPGTSTPVLHGRNGVVSVGSMTEDDMFYYFTPQCHQLQNLSGDAAVKSTILTINGNTIELMTTTEERAYLERTYPNPAVRPAASNVIWMDHEFGAAISETPLEHALLEARKEHYMNNLEHQWEWAALQLEGLGSISLTVLKDAATGVINDMFGIFQPAPGSASDGQLWETFHVNLDTIKDDTAPQPIKFKSNESVPTYTSLDTGKKFPNAWTAELPDFKFKTTAGEFEGLSFTIQATFASQEFITLPAKPSYWEGRITVNATPNKVVSGVTGAIRGTGFMECHGHVDTMGMEQLFMITKMMMFDPVKMTPKPTAFVDELSREQKLALAKTRHSVLKKNNAAPTISQIQIPEDVAESFFDVLFAGVPGDDLTQPGHNAINTLNTALVAQHRVSAAFETNILPLVRPTIQMTMMMVPGPKPPAEHVEFLCKAVAVYSFLHHYYGPALTRKGEDTSRPLVVGVAERDVIERAASVGGESSGSTSSAPIGNEEEALSTYQIKRDILWADVALGWLMREKRFLLTGTSGSHRMSGADAAKRNINPFKKGPVAPTSAKAEEDRNSILGPMPPRAGPKETILCALVERALEMLVTEQEQAFFAQSGTSLAKSYPFLLSKRHFHPIKEVTAAATISAPAPAPATPKKSQPAPPALKSTSTPAPPSALSNQPSATTMAPRVVLTIPEVEDGFDKGTLTLPVPSDAALLMSATDDEIQHLKHDFSGMWSKSKALGKSESISGFLNHQGVSLTIRMLTASLTPDLDTYVDLESKCVSTKIITTMVCLDILTHVNGDEYTYKSSGRGIMKCHACVFDNSANTKRGGGKIGLVAAAIVPTAPGGIEFKYCSMVDCKEPIMREVLVYYNQELVDKKDFSKPTATYRQYFTKKQ